MSALFFTFIILIVGLPRITAFTLPTAEYDALYDLYRNTDGKNWQWQKPYSQYGNPWAFTNPPENPCSSSTPWQGIQCTSTCLTKACYVNVLKLSNLGLHGKIPNTLGNLTFLTDLELDTNTLIGTIPNSLGSLTNLQNLYLQSNALTGSIPHSLGNLAFLTFLDLDSNNLIGTIPISLGYLNNLQYLFLQINQLTGIIPHSFSNLTAMYELDLATNQLTGTIPNGLGYLRQMTSLYIYENMLSGTIPTSMVELTSLATLWLNNNFLTGSIPSSLGLLTSLRQLYLFQNQFNGEIPSSFGNLKLLHDFWMYQNQLTGSIPFSLCNLTGLIKFDIRQNQLIGIIPSCLNKMKILKILYFTNNYLTGSIPLSLTSLTTLDQLQLDANYLTGSLNPLESLTMLQFLYCQQNLFSGTISTSFGNFSKVIRFEMNENQLTGTIPDSLGKLTSCMKLVLSQNFLTGSIPTMLGQLPSIVYLDLSVNQLTGTIPSSLIQISSLINLELDQNRLTGTIPNVLSNVTTVNVLALSLNFFSGTIPLSLFQIPNIINLDLYENMLTGTIPDLKDISLTLQSLLLNQNQLTGTIPQSLTDNTQFVGINLYQNQLTGNLPEFDSFLPYHLISLTLAINYLTGSIPDSFGNFDLLQAMIIAYNLLTGTIPKTFSNLSQLNAFELENNQFSGTLPYFMGEYKNIRYLYFGFNKFYGTIPASFSNWTSITELELNNNLLSGSIPEFGNDKLIMNSSSLQYLQLNENLLTGTIPWSVGNLIDLELLLLFQNELTGVIPDNIGNADKLSFIDLDTNQLTGTIPSSMTYLQRIQRLSLNTNWLTGDGIQWITSASMEILYLFDNILSGTLKIPSYLNLQAIDISSNAFSGSISERIFSNCSQLEMANLNNNAFTGSIPSSLFRSKQLISMILASNCFDSILPNTICNSMKIQELIFDGLHSAPTCTMKAVPDMTSSGVISKHAVHGSIPSCLLQMQQLTTLHLGGNSFSGSISDVTSISPNLKELILSNNEITGTVPKSLWQSNITTLDLSFNRLQGTLPSNMLPWAQDLIVDDATSNDNENNYQIIVKLQVNQFAGTMPKFLQHLSMGNIDILEGNMFACNTDRSDIPQNDPKAHIYNCGSDATNYSLLAFGGSMIIMIFIIFSPMIRRKMNTWIEMFKHQYSKNSIEILMMQHLYHTIYIITGLCLIAMILFGILSVFFSSYSQMYVWTISAIYKTGRLPTIFMFLWFLFCVLVMIWKITSFLRMEEKEKEEATSLMLMIVADNKTNKKSSNDNDEDQNQSTTDNKYCHNILIYIMIAINVTIVTIINGLYVSAIVGTDYSVKTLISITLGLSIFKIVWNFALVRGSHNIVILSDFTVLGACLFNNILAPLLAEMFASSDCFLYIVSQAPAVSFDYNVYICPVDTFKGYIFPCSFPSLIAAGDGIPVELSITPPFHYSYQCSFSLISSYAYVFVFRYVISGLIEPIVRLSVYHLVSFVSTRHTLTKVNVLVSSMLKMLIMLLSPLWQALLQMEIYMNDSVSFQNHLSFLHDYVHQGMLRRRLTVLLVTDLSMLICFGVLFPPLAVVIAVALIKDVMNLRLSLGRYCTIMEAMEDGSLKEQMNQLKEVMDREILKASKEIWNGLWYGMVMGTWIWAFVLFDTLASSVGVLEGLWVLVLMIASPVMIWFLQIMIGGKWKWIGRPDQQVDKEMVDSRGDATINPMTIDASVIGIEMKGNDNRESTVLSDVTLSDIAMV